MTIKPRSLASWLLAALLLVPVLGHADELHKCRERLQAMSVTEKEELARREVRFRALPVEEQERLRQLHEQITSAPDAARLEEVMVRYHTWLKMLRPGQRAELLSLPPDDRIARIRSIMQEQSIQRIQRFAAHKLESADVAAIKTWINNYLQKREQEILASMSPDSRQRYDGTSDEAERSRQLAWTLIRSTHAGELQISPEEVQELVSGLSRDAQDYLKNENDPRKRATIVRTWVFATIFSEYKRPVSNEELQRFVENELPNHHREFLESLPTERFRPEAERLYHFYRRFRRGHDDGRPGSNGPDQFPPFFRGPR